MIILFLQTLFTILHEDTEFLALITLGIKTIMYNK
jgi:hypothetical protein